MVERKTARRLSVILKPVVRQHLDVRYSATEHNYSLYKAIQYMYASVRQ